MIHEQPSDISLWSGGHDISDAITMGLEAVLVIINILPFCFVCLVKQKRTQTDELIVSLSITDILSVIIPGPLGWISYFTHQWYGGRHSCQFYQVCVMWFQLTSMCLVTFMTFDRWMSLKDALCYKTSPSGNKCRLRISVVLIYCFTLAISCLPLIGLPSYDTSSSGKLCQSWMLAPPENIMELMFHLVFLSVGYFNILTTVAVNAFVLMTLRKFQRNLGPKQAERMSSTALQIDRRSIVEFTVMILIVTLVFYLAWLPFLTFLTMIQFHLPIPDEVVRYSFMSTTLTGLLNPVIYGVFSQTYRRGYKKIFMNITQFIFGCPILKEAVIKKKPRCQLTRPNVMQNTSDFYINPLIEEYTESKDTLLGDPTFTTINVHAHKMQLMSADHNGHTEDKSFINTNYACESRYVECLLEKKEADVSRELYSSRISLLSDDFDDDKHNTANLERPTNPMMYIHESMI